MPAHSDLDIRMKGYEVVPQIKLIRRMPVIMRIDGRAFHTFLSHFEAPFDDIFINAMQQTALHLCKNVMNCVLAYTQSDEISLLLVDYKDFKTQPWFDNRVQKLCSLSASLATLEFFKQLRMVEDKGETYRAAFEVGAMFDSRCWNLPKEEVTNYFYSRQIDASRNSVQMVGHAYFSDKQLHKKSTSAIQDILHEEYGINWNDFPTYKKRGSCVIKVQEDGMPHGVWKVDKDIPMFKGEGREYIERLI